MNELKLIGQIRELLKTFPQVGFSGQRTVRYVDEDVLICGIELILKQGKNQ